MFVSEILAQGINIHVAAQHEKACPHVLRLVDKALVSHEFQLLGNRNIGNGIIGDVRASDFVTDVSSPPNRSS